MLETHSLLFHLCSINWKWTVIESVNLTNLSCFALKESCEFVTTKKDKGVHSEVNCSFKLPGLLKQWQAKYYLYPISSEFFALWIQKPLSPYHSPMTVSEWLQFFHWSCKTIAVSSQLILNLLPAVRTLTLCSLFYVEDIWKRILTRHKAVKPHSCDRRVKTVGVKPKY